jgi:hypothetical protein
MPYTLPRIQRDTASESLHKNSISISLSQTTKNITRMSDLGLVGSKIEY